MLHSEAIEQLQGVVPKSRVWFNTAPGDKEILCFEYESPTGPRGMMIDFPNGKLAQPVINLMVKAIKKDYAQQTTTHTTT